MNYNPVAQHCTCSINKQPKHTAVLGTDKCRYVLSVPLKYSQFVHTVASYT